MGNHRCSDLERDRIGCGRGAVLVAAGRVVSLTATALAAAEIPVAVRPQADARNDRSGGGEDDKASLGVWCEGASP